MRFVVQRLRILMVSMVLGVSNVGFAGGSHNIIDARLVIIWKMSESNVGVKSRFAVRCFKDKFQVFYVYAGSVGRSGQRFVNVLVAEDNGFIMFCVDVSQVSAKGLTLKRLSELIGAECCAVQFDVLRHELGCLRQIDGFDSLNVVCETLILLKPNYGLKDAPRAWRKKLHQVLIQWVSCR